MIAQRAFDFDGKTFDPGLDGARLSTQMGRVYLALLRTGWRTLGELAQETGDPEASVSARLRDLRKVRFGEYAVEARRRGDAKRGLWEYRLGDRA